MAPCACRHHAGLLTEGRNCLTPATFGNCATPRARAWRLGWDALPETDPSIVYAWDLHATIESRMAALDAQLPAVRYISSAWMFDRICDAASGTCGPNAPGTDTVIYYGDHHLSTAGSMYLAPFLNCELASFGLVA